MHHGADPTVVGLAAVFGEIREPLGAHRAEAIERVMGEIFGDDARPEDQYLGHEVDGMTARGFDGAIPDFVQLPELHPLNHS